MSLWPEIWLAGSPERYGLRGGMPPAKPMRIGLVGLDTSHVLEYLRLFNEPGAAHHVTGGLIVAACKGGSPEIEASRTRIDRLTHAAVHQYGVELQESVEAVAESADALMILSVDGRQHLGQFRQLARYRKPVFVDKPLAGSLADAADLVRLARESETPCFSCSSFRYLPDGVNLKPETVGEITAALSYGPADREPHHPDLFWYGIHAVEALYTVLGPGCRRVVRSSGPHADVVTGTWADGRVGTVLGNRHAHRGHGTIVTGTVGMARGGERHSYRPLALEIVRFFQTGVVPVPLDETLEIHAFMEAADESWRRYGAPVELDEVSSRCRTAAATPSGRNPDRDASRPERRLQ